MEKKQNERRMSEKEGRKEEKKEGRKEGKKEGRKEGRKEERHTNHLKLAEHLHGEHLSGGFVAHLEWCGGVGGCVDG